MAELYFRRGGTHALPQSFFKYRRTALRKIDELRSALGLVRPLIIEEVSAKLAGSGSIIVIHYCTSRPLMHVGRNASPYIIDQESGKRLDVQRVPYIGNLSSRSVGSKPSEAGYFIIDNSDYVVGPGSKVTTVIGELNKENVIIEG